MGHVAEKVDLSKFSKAYKKAEKIYEKEGERYENITNSLSFSIMHRSNTILDIIDPIVGLIPGIGDTVTTIASAPSLYFAIVEARSLKLTMAVLYYTIVDWLSGLVPVVGDIIDAFYFSNRKSYKACLGYIEGDPEAMQKINKAATGLVVLLLVLAALLYFAYGLVMKIAEWFSGLADTVISWF